MEAVSGLIIHRISREKVCYKIKNVAGSTSNQPAVGRILINLLFKCEHAFNLFYLPDQIFVGTERQHNRESTVQIFIHPQVTNSSTSIIIYETIKRELSGWNLFRGSLEELMARIVDFTSDMINSVSPSHDVLNVHVDLNLRQVRYVPLSRLNNNVNNLATQRSRSGMVRATESSIKSLLAMKKIDREDECCSICWDVFSKGCEVLCMPCSHEFHDQCIEKWLRTSHYCPMCRYKMPTN